jgi:FkbM family methyltransferase
VTDPFLHNPMIKVADPPRGNIRGEVPLRVLASQRIRQMITHYDNWPMALADRLRLLRRERLILYRVRAEFGRAAMVARTNGCDVRTINEIWVVRLYDKYLVGDSRTAAGPVVLDIGANCGYFSAYIGLRYPGATLTCFEPEPGNHARAEVNLALNRVNATVRPEAVVAGSEKSITLNLSDDPRLHTTVSSDEAADHGISGDRFNGRRLTVPAVNINDAITGCDASVDLLKIDVEGIDLELIMAIDPEVLSRVRAIVVETEDRPTTDVVDRLRTNGYDVLDDAGLLFAHRP